MKNPLSESPLNQRSAYVDQYDKSLLFHISRQLKRDELGIIGSLPFHGIDLWTAYELSWLDQQGKPHVAIGDIRIPCESPNLIESKSFKLYLNSYNNTTFTSDKAVQDRLIADLSEAAGAIVYVKLSSVEGDSFITSKTLWDGLCLDDLNVRCTEYVVNPQLLKILDERVDETTVYSHLLKSNCLVTGQPDWGSVLITYSGQRIDEASLLQYLVSFRNHNEFHEQCVERIFSDLMKHCSPTSLTVYARYTRRGGLDINPIRSMHRLKALDLQNQPLFRQ